MIEHCFLLTHSGRDTGGRFVITLWAKTADSPIAVVIDNYYPRFFVLHETDRAHTGAARERRALPMKTMDGRPVDCLYFTTLREARDCSAMLRARNIAVFESDIATVDRFLMEHFVRGGFSCEGERMPGTVKRMRNPRIRGADVTPTLTVLSLDIETNAATNEIYSIACTGTTDAVFIIGDAAIDGATACKDEADVLRRFYAHVAADDPDAIIGWNVKDFDLRIIHDRSQALGIPFSLGRDYRTARMAPDTRKNDRWDFIIPGRIVLDVPEMLRATFHTYDEYSLNFVAHAVLGREKLITGEGDDKIAEINRMFAEDKASLAKYNLEDARLTKEILDTAAILPDLIERTKRSGHMLDRLGGSIAAFDNLYLPLLHRAGFVAIDKADVRTDGKGLPGGYVLEPATGIYENVLVFDFKSLYPSIIMSFCIDPLGLISPEKDRINNPTGTSFARSETILPNVVRELMKARQGAKDTGNAPLSQAIKILMNSLYGVLGTTNCRFFSPELSRSITLTGQFILRETASHIEAVYHARVLYGDTDSLFVLLGPGTEAHAEADGHRIAGEINAWLTEMLRERFGADSALELEFESHNRHFLLPAARGGEGGSKKHYCGAVEKDGKLILSFTGMESVRSDWTDLAKDFQQELVLRLFTKRSIEGYILSVVRELRKGALDAKLIYRKRIRKGADEYTKIMPPHVVAAKLLGKPVRVIRYCITVKGPQPVDRRTAPFDYDHYVEKQLRPIAETLLGHEAFDKAVSEQGDLFA
ncbi:MAG: DNA polymerase II [Spirochaetes bacterium]|nr:DNA polymerase II [Spirochaetota bacterium]